MKKKMIDNLMSLLGKYDEGQLITFVDAGMQALGGECPPDVPYEEDEECRLDVDCRSCWERYLKKARTMEVINEGRVANQQ